MALSFPRCDATWYFVALAGCTAAFVSFPAPGFAQEGAGAAPDADREERHADVSFGPTTGFVVESADRRSRFELHFASWFRFESELEPRANPKPTFSVPLARPVLKASFFSDRLQAFVQPELAGDPALLDAFLDLNLAPAARLRLGQFRTPFSRAFINPIIKLQLPDRGMINNIFHLDRDIGLMLSGAPWGGRLEYYAGVFNGATINQLLDDRQEPMAVVRVVYNLGTPVPYDQVPAVRGPIDPGVAIGLTGAYRKRDVVVDPTDDVRMTRESWHSSADVAFMAGPGSASAEAYLRHSRLDGGDWKHAWGTFLQGGVLVWRRVLELVARAGWMDGDTKTANDWFQSYEAGINGYVVTPSRPLGHHLKASLRYAYDRAGAASDMLNGRSDRHRLTLQMQWWM